MVKQIKCPQCGANMNVEEGKDVCVCEYCGSSCKVETPAAASSEPTPIVININGTQVAQQNVVQPTSGNKKNKWVAFALCLFMGGLGAHKFYEGKGGLGILYIFTCGLFGIGWFIDLISLLSKPNPYEV